MPDSIRCSPGKLFIFKALDTRLIFSLLYDKMLTWAIRFTELKVDFSEGIIMLLILLQCNTIAYLYLPIL